MIRRAAILLLLSALGARLSGQSFDVMEATIPSVQAAMSAKKLTCHQLVQAYLDRIAAYDKKGPALNAIQTLNPRALAEADSLDAVLRAKQPRGPLHCVPVILKDQIETKDMPTSYGSILFKDFTPKRDATVVQRLHAAGAIIIAKSTMGEFALRYASSAAGVIHNAYDPRRNPSGSSGGSGAAVAANFGLVGIGEDTGGSIRGPAAVESLVGLRPTVPLISRFGMLPANPTQDTMGPMTRTVADAARMLDIMAGYDPNDPITAYAYGQKPASYLDGLKPDALKGARIGVIRMNRDSIAHAPRPDSLLPDSIRRNPVLKARLDSARRDTVTRDSLEYLKVKPLFEAAIAQLRALGAEIVDSLAPPNTRGSRFDNNYETEEATDKYFKDHPNAPYKTLKEILLASDSGKRVYPTRARSLMQYVGRSTSEPGYGELTVAREALRVEMLKRMADKKLDAIIYATYDAPPAEIPSDVMTNPRAPDGYGRGDNRGLSPTLAWPAITVPMGFSSDSLPAGLEFLGRPFSEPKLLGFAFAYEQATKHRRPPRTTPPLQPVP